MNILMASMCYLIFEKYNIEYNIENCLLALLSCIVINSLLRKIGAEGFEDGEPSEEESQEESPDQEESPEISEEIIEEISEEDESKQEEEQQQEEEPRQEEPQQEEPQQEEPQQKEEEKPKEEDKDEIKPYSSERLQELQKKYTIMPVESWIKNEINLMKKSQEKESCACPTLSRGSNNYLEF